MNRARRQATRIRAELRKAWTRSRADARAGTDREKAALAALRSHNERCRVLAGVAQTDELMAVVLARAPSLAVPELAPVLRLVASLPHARPVRDWAPRAKGRSGRLCSLLEHLFASCPVPSVLWRGFFDPEARVLAPLVVWLASGGSFHQYVKTRFPIPLTRKMCHLALTLRTELSLLRAIRKAEALAVGGNAALAHAWASSVHASQIGTPNREAFFIAFLEWLAPREHRNEDVAVLLDYAAERVTENAAFSMKGRTVESFLRDARAWHIELTRMRTVRQMVLPKSGFLPLVVARSVPKKIVWRVEEIGSTKDLFDEGRRMGHCVYSYANAAASGMTSIWVMTMEDGAGPTGRWAMLTIEVRNKLRAIVQARGRFNRAPTSEERTILTRFAANNGLAITV